MEGPPYTSGVLLAPLVPVILFVFAGLALVDHSSIGSLTAVVGPMAQDLLVAGGFQSRPMHVATALAFGSAGLLSVLGVLTALRGVE